MWPETPNPKPQTSWTGFLAVALIVVLLEVDHGLGEIQLFSIDAPVHVHHILCAMRGCGLGV